MSNSIVSYSALNASGTIGDAPIHFAICVIHADGSYEPPMSVSAAAQRDPIAFQAFADKVSHEAERLKSEQLEPTCVGLLVQLTPRESFVQAVQRALLTWQKSPFHNAFSPTEYRVNPAHVAVAPADIVGLTVILADTVPIRHVMVATPFQV